MNPSISSIKRYHLAKVYRRDQPAVTKGRMREFYQCDFDIAGSYDPMLPDAEIIRITSEVFNGLGWKGRYTIKVNHRKLLDGIFEICGAPREKIRSISSAVDKLDKLPWAEVWREMTEEKGVDPAVADAIGSYVDRRGSQELLATLQDNAALKENASAAKGLEDMALLFTYLSAFDVLPTISLDLSLARGLDYYTGVIYEVVTEGSAPPSSSSTNPQAPLTAPHQKPKHRSSKPKPSDPTQNPDEDRSSDPSIGVGSVAAGGRYDELVGMFSGKAQIPCVGISFGVDRIFSITKARMLEEEEKKKATGGDKKAAAIRTSEVDVYVMAFGGKGFTGLLPERIKVAKTLWDAGIKVEPCFPPCPVPPLYPD